MQAGQFKNDTLSQDSTVGTKPATATAQAVTDTTPETDSMKSIGAETIPHYDVYNLIILDESGSMESIKQSIITGFNLQVQGIQSAGAKVQNQDHYVSLVAFNGNGIRTILDRMPVEDLEELNTRTYSPQANTPLYDAICLSTKHLHKAIQKRKSVQVIVNIFTDGEENASQQYSGVQTTQWIQQLKEEGRIFT